MEEMIKGTHDFIHTCGGRGQRHRRGVVGHVFQVGLVEDIRIGDCPDVEIKDGDYIYCERHSGDCFQSFTILDKTESGFIRREGKGFKFGAYESFRTMIDLGEQNV